MLPIRRLRSEAGRRIRNFRRRKAEGVGHDFVDDLKSRLNHISIRTVFDVGAHIGVTALEFGDEFPDADVWAFEPHPANLDRLKANLIGKPKTRIHALGFSDKAGTLRFHFDAEHPSMARITDQGETLIEVETVDAFCAAKSVSKIDLMKIDVEGHEMPVLRGAERMLSEDRVAVIKLETAIDPDMAYHTQLADICDYLHPFGYRIFGFYDQWESTFADRPELRRFDAAFVSPSAINGRAS